MKAMILAAGRGERMRPLTDTFPKPMLKVAGIPLIEHHIIKLAKAGITDIVINHAWLGHKIEDYLKDGSQWGVSISYSPETNGALETAGGIIKALPLLLGTKGSDNGESDINAPFIVVNGDVYTDFDFSNLPTLLPNCLANIWLVPNPAHNKKGDFCLVNNNVVNLPVEQTSEELIPSFTFSGIGLYRSGFFTAQDNDKILPLGPLLKQYVDESKVSGSIMTNTWTDVGTPERLNELNQQVAKYK